MVVSFNRKAYIFLNIMIPPAAFFVKEANVNNM